MKSTNFFERIMQIADYKGFKSVNDFSVNGLKYKSSEKINRLRTGSKQPSVDILLDISNMFEEISPGWLLTGKGEMIKEQRNQSPSQEGDVRVLEKEIMELQREVIKLQKENAKLKEYKSVQPLPDRSDADELKKPATARIEVSTKKQQNI